MMREVYLKDWKINGEYVRLTYSDSHIVMVKKSDFDRAFGAIINASKDAVIRDFGVYA